MSADVELHDISINFGDFYAAKDVSVMIKKGEFLASLARLVAAKHHSSYHFWIFGTIKGPSADWRREYGWHWPKQTPDLVNFPKSSPFPLMSVADNISFSLEVEAIQKLIDVRAPRNYWGLSHSKAKATKKSMSFQAGNANESPSPGPWPSSRKSCFLMNHFLRLISNFVKKCDLNFGPSRNALASHLFISPMTRVKR